MPTCLRPALAFDAVPCAGGLQKQAPVPGRGIAVPRPLHGNGAEAIDPAPKAGGGLLGHVLHNQNSGRVRGRRRKGKFAKPPRRWSPFNAAVWRMRAESSAVRMVLPMNSFGEDATPWICIGGKERKLND